MSEERLREIGNLINFQDNRMTAEPVFCVEEERFDWGYSEEYCDDYKWIDVKGGEGTEADKRTAQRLDALEEGYRDTGKWQRCYFKKRWEFVTACFTEKGAKDYLRANGHNLRNPRIYVHSAYRNDEFIFLRKHLASFGAAPIEGIR